MLWFNPTVSEAPPSHLFFAPPRDGVENQKKGKTYALRERQLVKTKEEGIIIILMIKNTVVRQSPSSCHYALASSSSVFFFCLFRSARGHKVWEIPLANWDQLSQLWPLPALCTPPAPSLVRWGKGQKIPWLSVGTAQQNLSHQCVYLHYYHPKIQHYTGYPEENSLYPRQNQKIENSLP